jgi:hypothetical protein
MNMIMHYQKYYVVMFFLCARSEKQLVGSISDGLLDRIASVIACPTSQRVGNLWEKWNLGWVDKNVVQKSGVRSLLTWEKVYLNNCVVCDKRDRARQSQRKNDRGRSRLGGRDLREMRRRVGHTVQCIGRNSCPGQRLTEFK